MSTGILNRFDRIVAIFIQLQSGKVVKAQALADRFHVSLRTIYRDIKSLELSGVPVAGEPGIGYSVMEGYRLPPVMFTLEEASSFVTAEKLMQKFSDKKLNDYHQSAMFKVKSVLRESAKNRISALESQVWIKSGEELFNIDVPDALDILMESIAEKKQVMILYQSPEAEAATSRLVEPVGLFNENNYWHMKGFCHLRGDYRQFRTDRILQIQRTAKPFTRDHKEFMINSEPTHILDNKVVISVDKKILKYIRNSRKYYGFVSEEIKGDNVEMTFMTCDDPVYLARWFLMFGDKAKIIEPESFRDTVRNLLESIQQRLDSSPVFNHPVQNKQTQPA